MDPEWVPLVEYALQMRGLRYDDAVARLRRSDTYQLAYTEFTQGDEKTAGRLLVQSIEMIWPQERSDAVDYRGSIRRIQGPQPRHGQDVQHPRHEPEGG